jgi:hypothetical protein
LLRILSGKRPNQPLNQPIKFGNKCFSKPRAIAEKFCKQFSSVSSHKSNPRSRCVIRKLKQKHQIDPTFSPFTEALTKQAIEKLSSSTAKRSDGLNSLQLKFLGPRGIAFLTKLYNLSLARAEIPAVWKRANIVPIPKPGKPANDSKGYRPISLLSPAVKELEHLLLPYCVDFLPSAKTQHGYKAGHSTTTPMLPIVTAIATGFNKPKPASRTALVLLDISKAFNSVNHTLLLEKISGTDLHSNITFWLATYLPGRTAVCLFQGAVSSAHACDSGVPQGSVLSPQLFNFFVNDFPADAEINKSYADNFGLAERSPDLDVLGQRLTDHQTKMSEWAKAKKLEIAPSKSSVTLFTPMTQQSNCCPNVQIDGTPITLEQTPKWLGNILSTHFNSTPQAKSAHGKCSSLLQLLKAMSGQDWGDKETLCLTYKMFLKPVMGFGTPIWYPSVEPDSGSVKRLQSVQNAAMRTITGAHKMASQDHLLAECQFLPVAAELDLACSQFLASASRATHPSNATINKPTGTRSGRKGIVHTLQSRFGHVVSPFLNDNGVLREIAYKRTINAIHTATVTKNKRALKNKLLGTTPPEINPSEETLPCKSRTTLMQLQSTYCKDLKSYQARIGFSPDNVFPL